MLIKRRLMKPLINFQTLLGFSAKKNEDKNNEMLLAKQCMYIDVTLVIRRRKKSRKCCSTLAKVIWLCNSKIIKERFEGSKDHKSIRNLKRELLMQISENNGKHGTWKKALQVVCIYFFKCVELHALKLRHSQKNLIQNFN